ncbi:ricin-type beta-trefoil lectin domain protein, partial [Streptomyces fimicarius]|uniref:ricin-type beta-trefoil lectin domain protein n=1 Tax=Streptomyces griseus TaxID=1911 RepID=UPI003333E4FA
MECQRAVRRGLQLAPREVEEVPRSRPDDRRLQIWTCNGTPKQTWQFSVRASGTLQNLGTGECLDLYRETLVNAGPCNTSIQQQVFLQVTANNGSELFQRGHRSGDGGEPEVRAATHKAPVPLGEV